MSYGKGKQTRNDIYSSHGSTFDDGYGNRTVSSASHGSHRAAAVDMSSRRREEAYVTMNARGARDQFSSQHTSSRPSVSTVSSTAERAVSKGRGKKIITENRAKPDSMMINTTVSEIDNWEDADVEISNNIAEENSTMINYPLPQAVLLQLASIRSPR